MNSAKHEKRFATCACSVEGKKSPRKTQQAAPQHKKAQLATPTARVPKERKQLSLSPGHTARSASSFPSPPVTQLESSRLRNTKHEKRFATCACACSVEGKKSPRKTQQAAPQHKKAQPPQRAYPKKESSFPSPPVTQLAPQAAFPLPRSHSSKVVVCGVPELLVGSI